MEKMSKRSYTLKYAIPSLIITFLVLFLVCAGVNTGIKEVFKFLGWSMSVVIYVQWTVMIVVLSCFIYIALNSLGIINRSKNNSIKEIRKF